MYKSLKDRYNPERTWPGNSADPCPLDGDIPVLQFVNTCRNRGGINRKDYLKDYEDFLCWCCDVKLIDLEEFNGLDFERYCNEHDANIVWQRTIRLRETIHEFITCIMCGKKIHADSIAYFNELISEANAHLRFEVTENALQVMWFNTYEELAAPLWCLVKRAALLFQLTDFKKVKKCRCGNWYLDTTKSKNRRWCNPLTCGNPVRSKKYYLKKKIVEKADQVAVNL